MFPVVHDSDTDNTSDEYFLSHYDSKGVHQIFKIQKYPKFQTKKIILLLIGLDSYLFISYKELTNNYLPITLKRLGYKTTF